MFMREASGASVVRVESTESTQNLARDLKIGDIVVADHQTGGRGRLGRRWEAPRGTALLASFVLQVHPLASLAAGVATVDAVGRGARLKWPNDVLLDGRKLAGILVEMDGRRCVVGIGVNLTWAPPGAAMLDVPRDELLERLRGLLARWFSAPGAEVLEAWRERSDTIGRLVRVELAGQAIEGVAEALGDDGSLIVDGRAHSAGDVIHLRGPAGPRPPGT
jgi:BirA family biotin operon repressor/biotin-[acetyl-CoA-carboxylase] ligase